MQPRGRPRWSVAPGLQTLRGDFQESPVKTHSLLRPWDNWREMTGWAVANPRNRSWSVIVISISCNWDCWWQVNQSQTTSARQGTSYFQPSMAQPTATLERPRPLAVVTLLGLGILRQHRQGWESCRFCLTSTRFTGISHFKHSERTLELAPIIDGKA